jgi:SAM-dependent methyltransferase
MTQMSYRRGATMTRYSRHEHALLRGSTEHYLDARLYDHEYQRRRVDVNFYRRQAREGGREILELGCGTGRVLVPLVRDGHRVVGLDRSQNMLRRCAERVTRLPASVRERALLVRADFRRFALGRRWPLILCPFNAMMHLYNREDVYRFLECVRDHLAPGGRFCFDVLNPDLRWLTRDPHRRWSRTRFKDPVSGRSYYYSTNHTYDAATQIAWIRIYYDEIEAPAGRLPRSRVVELTHRQFFPEELLALLDHAGFRVERRDGGFDGEPFTAEADSQVCTCSMRD